MASVRMTLALKERLSENYKKQCQTAYNSSLNVDSTVKTIVEYIEINTQEKYTKSQSFA